MDGVDEHDVGLGVLFPRLANDTFHTFPDVLRLRAAVVYRELDKEQIRVVPQDVKADAEDAEVAARTADRRVDLFEFGLRILLRQPCGGLGPPAIRRCDGAAEIGHGHFLARRDFLHDVADASARFEFFSADRSVFGLLCQ